MAVIGTIAVNAVMRTGKLVAGARKTKKVIRDMDKTAALARRTFIGLGSAIVAGAITSRFLSIADSIDRTAKSARKLNIATEDLIGLRHAADQTAGAGDKVDIAIQRMTRRIAEAKHGSGEAVGALKALNLSAERLSQLTADKQFARIADAMNRVESQGERVRLTFKLFDSEGVDLVNTLRVGSKGLAEYTAEAKKLGLVFSDEEAQKVEKMNDELDKIKKHFGGAVNRLVIEFGPGVGETLEGFNLIFDRLRQMREQSKLRAAGVSEAEIRRRTGNNALMSKGAGGVSTADGFSAAEVERLAKFRNPQTLDNTAERERMTEAHAKRLHDEKLHEEEKERRKKLFNENFKIVKEFGLKVNDAAKDFRKFQVPQIFDKIKDTRRDLIEGIAGGALFLAKQEKPPEGLDSFEGNPLLEANSAEGFRALRRSQDNLGKGQLAETKKQTRELEKQTAAIEKLSFAATEEGI